VRCALLVQEIRLEWDDTFQKNIGYQSQLVLAHVRTVLEAEHRKRAPHARDKLSINTIARTVTVTTPIAKASLQLVPVSEYVHVSKSPKDNVVNLGFFL
jgi:hypothetical protein